jgi:Protein kinase domain
MSAVWRARDLVLDREVAIKILTTAGGAMSREAIRAEALAIARLAHPHIATVFDYGEADARAGRPVPYIVMELLRGRPLAALTQPATTDLALRIAAQVADALAAAHDHAVVHRDVKPGHIMLTPAGAKDFDFGLAAQVGDIEGADSNDVVLGTPAYASPERLVGAAVTPAADLYALGVQCLVTGALPWGRARPGPSGWHAGVAYASMRGSLSLAATALVTLLAGCSAGGGGGAAGGGPDPGGRAATSSPSSASGGDASCSHGVKPTDPGVVDVFCGGFGEIKIQAGDVSRDFHGATCHSAGSVWSASVGVVIDKTGLHGTYAGPPVEVVTINNTDTPGKGTIQSTLDGKLYFDLGNATMTLAADQKSAHLEGTSDRLSDAPDAKIVVDVTC